jgi:hypothetical protein
VTLLDYYFHTIGTQCNAIQGNGDNKGHQQLSSAKMILVVSSTQGTK